jgi:hypothetical protein
MSGKPSNTTETPSVTAAALVNKQLFEGLGNMSQGPTHPSYEFANGYASERYREDYIFPQTSLTQQLPSMVAPGMTAPFNYYMPLHVNSHHNIRLPTPQIASSSPSASPTSVSSAGSESPVQAQTTCCPDFSAREYLGLAGLVVDLNPFAAKHGKKGAMWEEVAQACKAKGLFMTSLMDIIKNKALALIKYHEVSPVCIHSSDLTHIWLRILILLLVQRWHGR